MLDQQFIDQLDFLPSKENNGKIFAGAAINLMALKNKGKDKEQGARAKEHLSRWSEIRRKHRGPSIRGHLVFVGLTYSSFPDPQPSM